MEEKLQELEKAIKHYRECVNVCAAEHIMGNAIYQLMIVSAQISSECMELLEIV